MIQIGFYNTLPIDRITPHGAFLVDPQTEEDVLLPGKFLTHKDKVGDSLNVFIYTDSEDRIVATTQKPLVTREEFAFLKVKDVNQVGAFLDWGLDKDLLVPFREQKLRMQVGHWYPVYLYLDEKSNRLAATAKIDKYLKGDTSALMENEQVELMIGYKSDIGINVIVNNEYRGLIYENEIFQDLLPGDRTVGFIKKIREDGKLDISLTETGVIAIETNAELLIKELKNNEGFLPLHDKSPPDEIQSYLQMSKKAFKKALGNLYKQKTISISENGIYLK